MRAHGPRQDQGQDEVKRVRTAPPVVSARALAGQGRRGRDFGDLRAALASARRAFCFRARRRRPHGRPRRARVTESAVKRGLHVVRFQLPLPRERVQPSGHDASPKGMRRRRGRARPPRSRAAKRSFSADARWADGRLRCSHADGFACDGLLLLAYPLHPGVTGGLRDAHLGQIKVPVLCLTARATLCAARSDEGVVAR